MKHLLLFAFIFLAAKCYSQDGLPHYMNDFEKNLLKSYRFPVTHPELNNPPTIPVRTMAEWEECQGIVIKWIQFTSILTEIVRYAVQEGNVFVLTTDSNSVKSALQSAGVPTANVKYIRGYTTGSANTIWSRDYGPWAGYSGIADSLGLVDWIYNRPRPGDDTNSVTIGQFLNIPVYRTLIAPNDLVHTGGNFMVDGNGTGFSSKLILTENGPNNGFGVSVKTEADINNIMFNYMGINRYIKMETLPYDQVHHIDMHIKLLDEETLLVGQYPPGIADGPQIEANLQYVLNNFQTCYGKPYKVIRIVMPPGPNGLYPPSGDYRTYTNSLIINRTVIVPTYTQQYDTTALRIYRESMPGYNIIGINCNQIIPSLGAIHCITKEIGVYEPVFISHSALRNTSNTSQPYEVKAYIKTRSGIASARMYWSTDTSNGFTQVNMSNIGDTFRANIPPQQLGTRVYYYIWANSISGRTVTKPLPAPRGNMQFLVTNATGIIQINTGIPGEFALHQNYPNPFNPSTRIQFDIPRSAFVSLRIYDISGREVLNITESQLNAGTYRYEWNASGLSSGVYFCRLSSENFTDVKKMLLLK